MAGDIEDFLRRAAQRRQQKSASSSQQQPPLPRQRQLERAVEPEIIVEAVEVVEPDILRGETVAQHVTEHIESSGFGERLSHLGEEVDRSDDRMEAHLHEVFEHELGQLGTQTSVAEDSTLDDDSTVTKPEEPALDILSMLSKPDSIQNAIILSEVLNRPENRW